VAEMHNSAIFPDNFFSCHIMRATAGTKHWHVFSWPKSLWRSETYLAFITYSTVSIN